jgi:cyclic-di-AMP phosphodiesterase PgpH
MTSSEKLKEKESFSFLYSERTMKWLVFLVTCISIATVMTLFIHGLVVKDIFEEGQIATSTIRAPRDITTVKIETGLIQGSDIKRGEVIVRAGDKVNNVQALKLRLLKENVAHGDPLRIWGAYFILSGVLILSVFTFFTKFYPGFITDARDDTLIALILVFTLIMLQVFSVLGHSLSETLPDFRSDTFLLASPLAAGGMILQIILGTPAVCVFVMVLSVLTGVFLGSSWLFLALVMVGNLVAASAVKRYSKRSVFLRAGLKIAAVNFVVVLAFLLLQGDMGMEAKLYQVLSVAIGGVLSGVLAAAFVPFAEFFGQYTTDMKLLELSSLDQPLLRDLSIQAPGTWNHSMVVGQMGESAAEAIKANPLLVRVGAYYHDIGKSKYPAYFIENQSGENRHDKLTPSMSALIIKAHIKDGIEMAMANRLPKELIDIIQQHHGTTLIEYFYEKAKRNAEEGDTVDERNFRYSGPKPQTKEAGILLLADTIEATSRTLPDPTPAKLQGLVQKMINKAFSNGELDESGLTLKDLHLIAKYFVRVLTGIYHRRITYPDSAEKIAKDKKMKQEENISDSIPGSGPEKSPKGDQKSENRRSDETKSKEGTDQGSNKKGDSDDTGNSLKRLGI